MKNNPYYNKKLQDEVLSKIPEVNPLGPIVKEEEEVRAGRRARRTPKSFYEAHIERRTLADNEDEDPSRKERRLKRLMWGLG